MTKRDKNNQNNKNIHDSFVKKALSNKTVAREFLTKPIQIIETRSFEKDNIKDKYYAGLMMYFMNKIHERDISIFKRSDRVDRRDK